MTPSTSVPLYRCSTSILPYFTLISSKVSPMFSFISSFICSSHFMVSLKISVSSSGVFFSIMSTIGVFLNLVSSRVSTLFIFLNRTVEFEPAAVAVNPFSTDFSSPLPVNLFTLTFPLPTATVESFPLNAIRNSVPRTEATVVGVFIENSSPFFSFDILESIFPLLRLIIFFVLFFND